MFRLIRVLPTLFLPGLIYTGIKAYAFYNGPMDLLSKPLFHLPLPDNKTCILNVSDGIIILGLFMLYFEIIKSTDVRNIQIIEHIFSFLLVLIFFLEFLLAPFAADSTLVILLMMAILDLIAGITVTITATRKDISISGFGRI
ncbi:MAG: hypothetical protein Q9P90_09070 [candidate division KSB1 bacterium]|nr:hypothetical protein [candidate division KSB1 bacterium]